MKFIKVFITFTLTCLCLFGQSQSAIPTGKSYKGADSLGAYTFAEQNPEFLGGDGQLLKFIKSNMRYPQMEKDNHIEGQVLVRFVINEEGKVESPTITKSVSYGLDREAIRLVKLLPAFVPGHSQGKAVKVYFNLPVEFKL